MPPNIMRDSRRRQTKGRVGNSSAVNRQRHAGGRGDVSVSHVVRPAFQCQSQRCLPQCLSGGLLPAGPHRAPRFRHRLSVST
jgi:hypothetical protein